MSLQLEAKRECVLCSGVSGSGKTTFALRYLVADKSLACRFLFDAEGEFAQRLGLTACKTQEECELAVDDGFVVFDPHGMFPGDLAAALEWFCEWCFDASSKLAGRKMLLIDEVWMYCTPGAIPKPLAVVVQTGRKRGLGTLFASQRPNRINEAITNGVTEAVCFRLQGENALKRVSDLGADPVLIASLAEGQFVSVLSDGREFRGRLW
jgi:DNA helicase HerA-like ATPase